MIWIYFCRKVFCRYVAISTASVGDTVADTTKTAAAVAIAAAIVVGTWYSDASVMVVRMI
jgi:hypothetical protein